jgi:hypothetical protein
MSSLVIRSIETARLSNSSNAARLQRVTPIAKKRRLPTCNDPVAVRGLRIVGRVCGRTEPTSDYESLLNVLDAKGAIHRNIPARLAECIDEADCPVPRFESRSLPR